MSVNDLDVLVMYAPVTDSDMTEPLVPSERQREVEGCKNERARREKYLVWKLLKKAAEQGLNLDFDNVKFTKTEFGQWISPDFFFSLSHSDGAVCVAVSRAAVGVDIEKVRALKPSLHERFLSEDELRCASLLSENERNSFFLDAWVKKESIFKMRGGKSLLPRSIDTAKCDATVEHVSVHGEEYLISLACQDKVKYEIIYTEEI